MCKCMNEGKTAELLSLCDGGQYAEIAIQLNVEQGVLQQYTTVQQ